MLKYEYGNPKEMTAEEVDIYYPELNTPNERSIQVEKELQEIDVEGYFVDEEEYERELLHKVQTIVNQ